MTRADATRLVKALFATLQTESPGLNEQGFGGIMLPDADLYFEHQTPGDCLICYGRIFEFRKDAAPAVIDALRAEGQSLPSGVRVEYIPETRRLFLARTYNEVVEERPKSATATIHPRPRIRSPLTDDGSCYFAPEKTVKPRAKPMRSRTPNADAAAGERLSDPAAP